MPNPEKPPFRVPLSFAVGGSVLAGTLVMAIVCAVAAVPFQLVALGALVGGLGGLSLATLLRQEEGDRQRNESLERLAASLALAPEHDLYVPYLAFRKTLTELAARTEPLLRKAAALKLASVNHQVESLPGGSMTFAGTEAWRAVYEALLGSPEVRVFRSVAWVRSPDYWQDRSGRRSMEANFDAADRGVLVERIVILRDDLWPRDRTLPADTILPWLEEQHDHGFNVSPVRESDLTAEPDLVADIGVYGDHACYIQELDEMARTIRFVLSFDPQAVRQATDRWHRLAGYSTPMNVLLDQVDENR